jgi:hypothetical protein
MSTYHLSDAVRPLVDWTTGYAVRRRLWPAGAAPAGPLTPRDAAHVIRTIDAVCDDATAGDLPSSTSPRSTSSARASPTARHVPPDRASVTPAAR